MPLTTKLRSREIVVLHLVGSGNANKQIADTLSLGETTVKHHISNILSKLSANERARMPLPSRYSAGLSS